MTIENSMVSPSTQEGVRNGFRNGAGTWAELAPLRPGEDRHREDPRREISDALMDAITKQPRHADGSVAVAAEDCCDVVRAAGKLFHCWRSLLV